MVTLRKISNPFDDDSDDNATDGDTIPIKPDDGINIEPPLFPTNILDVPLNNKNPASRKPDEGVKNAPHLFPLDILPSNTNSVPVQPAIIGSNSKQDLSEETSTKADAAALEAILSLNREDQTHKKELLSAQIDLVKAQEKRISTQIQLLSAQEKREKWTWQLEGLKTMLEPDSKIDEETRTLLEEKYKKLALALLED